MIFTDSFNSFKKLQFNNEKEVEKVVADHYRLLFGDLSMYLEQVSVETPDGKSTTPDGIVVDFKNKRWFIVEVERGIHDLYKHIIPQVSKQQNAAENEKSRLKIINECLSRLEKDGDFATLLSTDLHISSHQWHGCIDEILKTTPLISIPIDGISQDLQSWVEKNKFKVQLIEQYVDKEGNHLYDFPGLEDELENEILGTIGMKNHLAILVREKILKADVDKVHFEYAPKGVKKQTFSGIIRKDGIEVDGLVLSPSDAALHHIQKIAPTRTTSNGWVTWKTEEGELLDSLWKKYQKRQGIPSKNSQKKLKTSRPVNVKKNKIEKKVSGKMDDFKNVLASGLLKVGDKVSFTCGRKGKNQPKSTFKGVVRKNGIEVDGEVLSVSESALRCIRKVAPDRRSCNGWLTWRTGNGKFLDELRK